MKWIRLADNDYKLFDQEIDAEQNEYMQSHLSVWEKMFQQQGQPFWLHFLISYRFFTLNCGFANNLDNVFFPLCKGKLKRLIDDACVAIHKEFIEATFSEVKKLFNDIVVVVKNRHLIPHLGSKSSEEDPFYHEATKNAYRDLFCESGDAIIAWKVAVGLPFYLKFAGAIFNVLKRWIQEKTLDDKELEDISKNPYWKVPMEWCDKDFKPGIFEHYLLKFWDKKLVEVLNIDNIYEKFSRKVNYDPCYLENDSLSCICDNNHVYGTNDIDDSTCKCTKKIVHKAGSCRIRSDLLPSEVTNTIAQAQKVHDTKERLRKKLGKKLRNKGEGNAITDDCVADSDWRLKLLEKAEKQFRKESKNVQKKDENLKSESEKQTKTPNKTKKSDLKELDNIDAHVTVSAEKKINHNPTCTTCVKNKIVEKMKIVDKNNVEKGCIQISAITSTVENVSLNTKQTNVEKNEEPATASSLSEKDELTKDLENIGDNLDNIEKSIKEKGGLDLEEFKLLWETGRLLTKENKSVKTGVKSDFSNISLKVTTKFHACAQCMTKESAPKTFKKCSRCKLEKFAVPRYYCSKKCQVEDWEESHRDEHLRASGYKA